MIYRSTLLFVILATAIIFMVSGQVAVSTQQPQVGDDVLDLDLETDNPPQDPWQQFYTAQNFDDLVALLKDTNGQPLNRSEVIETDAEGKTSIRGGGRMAIADNCSPRNETVTLTHPNLNSDEIYFPPCTQMERCGGCTNGPNLKCIPGYTERVSLKVFRVRKPQPGTHNFVFVGFETVLVTKHVSCRLRCDLSAEKCGPRKRFSPSTCQCLCTDRIQSCAPPKQYNPEKCECECPTTVNCCANQHRGCRLVYDNSTCRCVLRNGPRSANSDMGNDATQEAIERFLNSSRQQENSGAATAPRIAQIAATQAPPITTRFPAVPSPPRNRCAGYRCPIPGSVARYTSRGCRCIVPQSSRRHRQPRPLPPRPRGSSRTRPRHSRFI